MKQLLTLTAAAMLSMSVLAESRPGETTYEAGFLSEPLNEAIAQNMEQAGTQTETKYGRKVTDFVTPPKFGGYFMYGYYYTGEDSKHNGDGFRQKNARLYVSGSLFKEFNYLVQIQLTNNAFHMKDYWIEWKRYTAFSVKAGQFIRSFGFENPYNPFEFHDGAYAQITQKLAGGNDRIGTDNGSGRDQGIQIQGDLFPVGKDGHRLLRYQLMLSNGQTINSADANSQKDISGTLQVQPIQGLYLAFYGWTGNHTAQGVTVSRDRYMLSAFYDVNDWTARAEFAHSTGHKISDYNAANGSWTGSGKAQGWYTTLGIPCTPWLKTWIKYDAYQDDARWSSTKSIYSVSPNFQLHRNLWFQPRVAYVHDRTMSSKNDYMELSVEAAVRF